MATTTETAATTITHQGWAQPTAAVRWHYYRFTEEPTGNEKSLCGAYGTDGIEPTELHDKNHTCADHCQGCQRRRL